VKFPKRIKHRGKVLATIYGKSKSYALYRVAWTVAGKRVMKAFARHLFEAGGLKHEPADLGEMECYTAGELRALLERASKQPGPTKAGRLSSCSAAAANGGRTPTSPPPSHVGNDTNRRDHKWH
jgi:hypothetical protein